MIKTETQEYQVFLVGKKDTLAVYFRQYGEQPFELREYTKDRELDFVSKGRVQDFSALEASLSSSKQQKELVRVPDDLYKLDYTIRTKLQELCQPDSVA